jgi:hypothetical protein
MFSGRTGSSPMKMSLGVGCATNVVGSLPELAYRLCSALPLFSVHCNSLTSMLRSPREDEVGLLP